MVKRNSFQLLFGGACEFTLIIYGISVYYCDKSGLPFSIVRYNVLPSVHSFPFYLQFINSAQNFWFTFYSSLIQWIRVNCNMFFNAAYTVVLIFTKLNYLTLIHYEATTLRSLVFSYLLIITDIEVWLMYLRIRLGHHLRREAVDCISL